ncbi:MAG TPA: LptA/OstA family protein [Atribacteraceae bacterium]|nr:LptA/OstA family protein [Atribacteraceae bacterium]
MKVMMGMCKEGWFQWIVSFGLIVLTILGGGGIPVRAQDDTAREVVIRTSLAEYDEETGLLSARGESTITWQDITMICPYLEVDTLKREAHSSGDIRVLWGGKTIVAEKLHFLGKENRATLEEVTGTGADMHLSAGLAAFDFTAEQVSLTGNPILRINDYEMRSDAIRYSFAAQYWEAAPVWLSRQDWEGRADRGMFREGSDSIELVGNARVEREGSLLQGEKITVFHATGRIRVEGDVEITIVD